MTWDGEEYQARFDRLAASGTDVHGEATLVRSFSPTNARHVAAGGLLVAGFSLDRGYGLSDYDQHAAAAGLVLVERWATWDRQPHAGGAYAVSVHRAVRT